jgi:hypothetical protein
MAEYIIQSAYGSEIPPWSALEITAGSAESGRTVYTVTRPTADNLPAGRVLFSGACAIAAGGYGMGYSAFDKAVFCAGTADGTTGYCGVAANSFELSGTNTGFVCPTRGAGRIPVRPFAKLCDTQYIKFPAYIKYITTPGSGVTEIETEIIHFKDFALLTIPKYQTDRSLFYYISETAGSWLFETSVTWSGATVSYPINVYLKIHDENDDILHTSHIYSGYGGRDYFCWNTYRMIAKFPLDDGWLNGATVSGISLRTSTDGPVAVMSTLFRSNSEDYPAVFGCFLAGIDLI